MAESHLPVETNWHGNHCKGSHALWTNCHESYYI